MAQAEPPAVVVCDAGPLIHLDELRSLDLLVSFQQIYVPAAVWREVQMHRPSALRRRRVPLKRVDDIPEPVPDLVQWVEAFTQSADCHAAA